ncbi:MAG: GAF domain-containing protein [Archangium sp.]|nr:GAF domain-containing protein [Archangium sp.]MDP3572942.1 GAF domain-containing protein [Archangium sp.]
MNFEQMSKEELVERLKLLEGGATSHARVEGGETPVEHKPETAQQRLLNSLQVHEVELELQNRGLKEMQRTLEQSRARYAELFDSAPLPCFTFDENGCVLEVNVAGAALVGGDRSRLIGAPFASLVHLEEASGFWSHLRECAESRSPSKSELSLATPEGGRVTLQTLSTPVLSAAGRVIAFRTAFTDITAHRRAESEEREARNAEEQLRARLEAVDGATLRITHALATPHEPTEAVLQTITEQATLLTGADYGALALGDRLVVVPPCPGLEAVLGDLEDRRLAGLPFTAPPPASLLGVPLHFGEARLGTLYVANKRGPGGFTEDDQHCLEMLAERVCHAIQLARLNDEQRHDRERLQLLSDTSRALASTLDPAETLSRVARIAVPQLADWVVLHRWDGERLRFASAAHRDPEGEQQLHHFHAKFEPLLHGPTGLLAQVANTRAPVLLTESSRLHPVEGASDAPFEDDLKGLEVGSCLGVPVVIGQRLMGTIFFQYGTSSRKYDARDVSLAQELAFRTALALDNARLYQEAQAAVRSRDNVMAIVSHDLRNPLNAIALNLSLLTRPFGDERDGIDRRSGRSQLESIKRSVQRVGRMVEDLLAASTIQAGHFSVRACPESLDVLVGDLVQTLAPMATEQGTTLVTDFPPDLPAVTCDRDRVLQVFGNLCGNAMHVTPRGGSIRVTAMRDGAFICFRVSDTGPGIPAAQLASVFDRYWQAAPGSSSGAGLGLFIVKGIIEAHGGKVWADSPANEGASFFFTLPVAP